MNATELGDAVVAVLEKHLVVELFGAAKPDGGIDRLVAFDVEVPHELLQEQTSEAERRS